MSEAPHSPGQAHGEAVALPAWGALPPAIRAGLLDPEIWYEGLDAYAHTTHLAVALVDPAGRLLGECLNPQPTWRRLHVPEAGADGGCPFALAPRTPCTCVGDALARRELILVRDHTGLVHFAVPLLLGDTPLGALLAGQVFDRFPEPLPLERMAQHVRVSPLEVWQEACREYPVKQATLRVYGRLLASLGQTFLQTRYYTLLDAHRLAALEQLVQERTAALHREMAERQRLEQEAQRVQHFALLGRLAAGVSHEIRNPLGAVLLNVDLLAEELQEQAPASAALVAEPLTEIRTNLARVEDLVQDYLSLVRAAHIARTPQDLGAALRTWLPEWQALAAARGSGCHGEGLEALGVVAFHAQTLQRALLNLVQNALEAMPEGGQLTLRGQATATHVRLQVQDGGSGIPAGEMPRIFEPLYTTKPGGTGLGLYIVQEIVRAHGGQVAVESAPGQGTTVTVTLPRGATAAAPRAS
jgi:signal transduction histidine kinase